MGTYATIGDFEENIREEVEYTLLNGEQFLGAISCADGTKLILTDRRLIEFNRGILRQSANSFSGEEITAIDYQKNLLTAEITLTTKDSDKTFQFMRNEGQKFASAARNQFLAPGSHSPDPIYQSIPQQQSLSNNIQDVQSADNEGVQTTETALERLQRMDDYDFEHLIADLWERMGWSATVSQASVDAGIDVTASKSTPYPQKQLIQAKRYKSTNTVGGPDIQQYASLKHQQDNVDSVVVVTTSSFTNHAEDRAEELNVKLIDGKSLVLMLQENDASDLLDKYVPVAQNYGQNASEEPPAHNINESSYVSSPNDSITESKSTDSGADTNISSTIDSVDETKWITGVKVGTGVWTLGLLAGIAGVSGGGLASLLGLAALVCWVVLPLSVYNDAQYVSTISDWSPMKRTYTAGAAFPMLNALVGLLYLYRRHQALS